MNLGDKLIDFSLLGVNDSYFNSVDISNKKKIVIFFTCNHCPYVHAYEKRIIKLQKSYRDIVQFIGINSNDDTKYPEDSFEKMKERSRDNNFNFIYVRDLYQEVAKIYNASHTPHFFLFNKDKILIYKGKLDDNWEDENKVENCYLEDAIRNPRYTPRDTFPVGCSIKWL